MRLAALAAASAAAALLLAGPGAAAPGELASPARCSAPSASATLLCYVNAARRANGARPLAAAPPLGRAAGAKGAAIVRCGQFTHGPCGGDPVGPVRASGYAFRLWGENLYWGSGRLASARSAVQGWLRSPGHRRAMLDARFREVGVAAVRWPGRGTLWVLELGAR